MDGCNFGAETPPPFESSGSVPELVLPEEEPLLPSLPPGTSGVGPAAGQQAAEQCQREQKCGQRMFHQSASFSSNRFLLSILHVFGQESNPEAQAQMTFFSSQLPLKKRMAKKRERNSQSRNMPPQMLSRLP